MTDGFLLVSEVLEHWPARPACPSEASQPLVRRVLNALESIQTGSRPIGAGDLGGLLRAILRTRDQATGGHSKLVVPSTPPFPSASEWSEFGIKARETAGITRIEAEGWQPSWLDGRDPTLSTFRRDQRRAELDAPIPTDPLVKGLTGYSTFQSPGQKLAVACALLAAPGETLLINLPTGEGKTLGFLAPALRGREEGKLSVIIVPTVALAEDHQRRLTETSEVSHRVAYHAGLPQSEKDAIKDRIRSGEQWIVFTSPESAMGALSYSILARARKGQVCQLVVDEAHLVIHWGLDFRPDFSLLSGFRDVLSSESPSGTEPTTLLLSATITQSCRQNLSDLFGSLSEISALRIRPEPEYWHARASTPQERDEWVTQAVKQLPRPLIIYTTLTTDATDLFKGLQKSGIQRIARVIGGDLSATHGSSILEDWNAGHIDVIVATSAFGLGMDNTEVHAVLHACLPETVDRFYQEVGRVGRDGRASLSLMVTEPGDVAPAESLSTSQLITKEKGWPSWQAMWAGCVAVSEEDDTDRFSVDLDAIPKHRDSDTEWGRGWNLKTLVLMAKAGIIKLDVHRPPIPQKEGSVPNLDAIFRRRSFRLMDGVAANDQTAWAKRVDPLRTSHKETERREWDLLMDLYHGRRPYNEIFAEAYSDSTTKRPISKPVGSCPVTRKFDQVSFSHFFPGGTPPDWSWPCPKVMQARGSNILLVGFNPLEKNLAHRVDQLLPMLVSDGVREIAAPKGFLSESRMSELARLASGGYLAFSDPLAIEQLILGTELPLPRVSLFLQGGFPPKSALSRLLSAGGCQIILIPRDTPALEVPHWLLINQHEHMTFRELERRMTNGTT